MPGKHGRGKAVRLFFRERQEICLKNRPKKDETELLGKFVSLDSLNEMNRLLVFGIAEGLSLKEMQSLTGRGERYIQTCLQRLKKRFNVLERRELFTALIKWISLDAGAAHTG